ncbi:cache domain-containing sensor histidine kinase [Metabacillus halosaccharovorans]|uniref:cache domain-containing sensor histidine kinase n=1 Tax=Metabacillus halosaccharovorans TaxID=930124 RepID=UPI0020415B05|nr:sensor histidine kinase [Metabacillus halosaccharovorans]MCM3439318.1 sensor histidine kinase [Metabacillus halosaccharovorans]
MRLFALNSIKKKLLAVYLPLIILLNIIILFVAHSFFSYEMERASHKHAKQTVEAINRHLETYLEELERLSLFPYFHNDMMDILRNTNQNLTQGEKYKEYKFFENMFNNIMLNPREDLLNVSLFREDGRYYFNSRVYVNLNQDYDWKNTDWYKRTIEANGNVVYTLNSNRDGRFTVLHHDLFLISRLVKSENGKNLGTILIDANFQGIADVLKDVGLGQDSNVILRDENDNIIFSQNKLYLKEIQSASSLESNILKIENETLFLENLISDKTGWKVSVIISSDEISNSFVLIRKIILIMLILFGVVTTIVTLWFSDNLTRPIRELRGKMKMVESGNYDVSLEVSSKDEIGSLGHTFNRMSSQIKELIHEVYEYNIRQKEAELNNLKMQIRPHFLYNTLEAIRSLADIHDNNQVVEMTTSLGSILRYSIKTHQKHVPIEMEVDYVQQYLTIQQIMVGDSIKVEYDIEASILQYYSIPLLFQPLVENAFQHGLYGKRQGGLIRIVGRRVGDELHFSISDNGKGISRVQMALINKALQVPFLEKNADSPIGIGLSNVNQRIKIVFGESYGLYLNHNPEGGTSVHIRIPMVKLEQKSYKVGV